MKIKNFFLSFLLFPALIVAGCERDGANYQYRYYGYVVTGEQGAAEPLKGVRVFISNYNKVYAETVTSDAGLFLLKVRRKEISDIDKEEWFEEVRLSVVEKSNKYYSASCRIAYPSLGPVNCGVIFLLLRNK